MNTTALINIGTLTVLLLSIVVLILAGYLGKKTSMKDSRSLQLSFLTVFTLSFLSLNLLLTVSQIRIVVAIIAISFIIPFSITFMSIWVFVSKPTITRIQYVAFFTWMISLFITMCLRFILGWGFPDGIIGATVFVILSSVSDGLLGALLGHVIINRLEVYRPTQIS